ALRALLPAEDFVYLGDTARLPYGTKSASTVQRYARQASAALIERDVKALVVACNTASAFALPMLQATYPQLPVCGVVEPGAAAVAETAAEGVLVLATEGTVQEGAYSAAILRRNSFARVWSRPCQLLVALAEDGRVDGPITQLALKEFAAPAVAGEVRQLLLGCTHFPVFKSALTRLLPDNVRVVDSAATTAQAVADVLAQQDLLNAANRVATVSLLVTDGVARFARLGQQFLGEPVADVELINL
ncbi:MAG: glutamate racemase, partial [Pseudomonadales bacterium]